VDVERPCRSTTYFEKIGPVVQVRLEPVIFDRRMTRQYQERCDVVDVIGVAGRRVAGEAERS
jgi:hypothetical protein